jgi:hypothetical protein
MNAVVVKDRWHLCRVGCAALLLIVGGCTSFGPLVPGVTLFGYSWQASIRSPFGLSGTLGKPHYFQEVVQAYGSFGPVQSGTYLDKYYFDFRSKWLHIVNDQVDAADPADSLAKIWTGFGDAGISASGAHAALVIFRCGIRDKLGLSPNSYAVRTCRLEVVDEPGATADRFTLTVKMATADDDYVIKASGGDGKGIVYFRP